MTFVENVESLIFVFVAIVFKVFLYLFISLPLEEVFTILMI